MATINTTFQNLWDTANAVLRGKFIVIQVYLKKQEKSNKKWSLCIISLIKEKWTSSNQKHLIYESPCEGDEERRYRLGENVCKPRVQERINI